MKLQQVNYETKCRRCGHLTELHFGYIQDDQWNDFEKFIDNKINNPRLSDCIQCGILTIQDVTSYTPRN